jgi:CRISPR system Cascade subunit CasA
MKMNLAHDPWIPVIWKGGGPARLSLIGAFERTAEVADLAARPHEKVALLRLLGCIGQAACLDADALDFGAAAAYLRQWAPRFELFGPGPRFLQLKTAKAERTEASRLWFPLANGNNHTVDDHGGGSPRHFSPEALALALLAFQNFAPLGGRGYRGGVSARGPAIDANMLHVYRWGGSLAETLRWNFLPAEEASGFYPERVGRPVWELDPNRLAANDPKTVKEATWTWLGRLAPLTRAIWLDEGGALMALDNGLEYPTFRESTAVLYVAKTKTGEQCRLLSARLDQDLWRSLPAFTACQVSERSGGGPLALQALRGAPEDCPVWCAGLVSDFQAKILDAVDAHFVLPAGLFTEGGRQTYEGGVRFAETMEKRLRDAVALYVKEAAQAADRSDVARRHWTAAVRHYWNAVTQAHGTLLALSGQPPQTDSGGPCPWRKEVWRAAWAAFRRACPAETCPQIQAFAKAQKQLLGKPKDDKKTAKTKPKKVTHAHA